MSLNLLHERLAWTATAFTVSIMFFSIIWLQPLFVSLQASYVFAGGVAASIVSLGVYRVLAGALMWFFKQSVKLRALVLGKSFLEGTWVGHYTRCGNHRFTIEYIDQSSGTTVILGREFDEFGKTRALWASDSVSIDTVHMQLVYSYKCTVFERKHVQEGLGVFRMVQQSADSAAQKLDGYSVDLIDGDRDPNTEHKVSDSIISDENALNAAREIFNVTSS